jgi:hypothetical protein
MGKCVSKEKNLKKDPPINRSRREESICTPVQSEGARNMIYSGPLPVFLQKNEVEETRLDNNLKTRVSRPAGNKKPVHNRNPSKISIDFDQLSKLKIEQEMLLRIGKSLYELAKCYQNIGKFCNSIEILQLAGEIFMHLSLYCEYNQAMTDLILAYIETSNSDKKLPVVVEPLNDRTLLCIASYKLFAEGKDDPILEKFKVNDLDSFREANEKLEDKKFGKSKIVDALLDLAHLFRIWLLSPEESLNLYEEASEFEPDNHEIYFYKGLTYRALGEIELAVDNYIQGINKKGNYAECYFNLGNIYLEEMNNLTEAEACYLNALFGCENGYEGLVSVGKICVMLSEVYEKQENYKKALEVCFQGIGADFLHIEVYIKASKIAKILGFFKLSRLLETVECIINNESFFDLPEKVEEEVVSFKSVLFGSLSELLRFIKNLPTQTNLSRSEKIEVKKYLSKLSSYQIEQLSNFCDFIEKI